MARALLANLFLPWLTVGIAAQQPPTFKSRVDLVTVDVSVLGPDGRPLEGLDPDAFSLKVDDKPRRLVSAQYVTYGTPASTEVSSPTNPLIQVSDGRVLLVAVDQGNIRRVEGGAALKAAAAFIDTLQATDRLAAVGMDATDAIRFTPDHAQVKRTLSTLLGRAVMIPAEFPIGIAEALGVADGSRAWLDRVVTRVCGQPLARVQRMERMARDEGLRDPCPTHVEQQARALAHNARSQGEQSVDALKRLLRRLDDIEGPKTLVLLSEGLIAEPRLVDMTEVSVLAQQARTTVYVLQVDVPVVEAGNDAVSPTGADDVRARGDGLARVAGATGGALLQLVGSDPQPFQRILRESSGYYLLAFEPTAGDRDGAVHRISVSVRRPGVTVRARPVFTAPPPPAAPLTIEDQLVQLLRTRRLMTELGMRLGIVNSRGDEREKIKSQATIEMDAPVDATYGAVVVDAKGIVVTSATSRSTTGQFSFPVAVAPGRYLFRAAVIEPTGRAGTTERVLDVQLNGRALPTSDIMLSAHVRDVGELPIVDRTSSVELTAVLELYAPADWKAQDSVALELSPGNSAPAQKVPAVVRWTEAGHWVARATFTLADLPAGRYVVTARIPGDAPVTRSFLLIK